ncbi:MAG: HPr-rel-A system PqqD family peptide chaperone [Magnetococcales bacterium]|nr:HPr-rel-A system PqqD family peptide chaperone [Magnetococcales bacterium]
MSASPNRAGTPLSNDRQSWSVPRNLPLTWEPFEEAFFVFNPLSNETHVLNALAVEILDLLRQGPATLPELLALLGVEMNGAPDDATLPYRTLLQALDQYGLIVPVES